MSGIYLYVCEKCKKTTEDYFQEFYNEVRRQAEQEQPNFTRANQIWEEYQSKNAVYVPWKCECGYRNNGFHKMCGGCGIPRL